MNKRQYCFRCDRFTNWKRTYDEYRQESYWYCPICAGKGEEDDETKNENMGE